MERGGRNQAIKEITSDTRPGKYQHFTGAAPGVQKFISIHLSAKVREGI